MTFKLARFIHLTQKPPGTMGECIPSGGIGARGRKFGNAFGRLCSYFACLVSLSVLVKQLFHSFPIGENGSRWDIPCCYGCQQQFCVSLGWRGTYMQTCLNIDINNTVERRL